MEMVFFAILECVTTVILAVFVRRISCHVEARTNSGRMKHFPVTFFAAALTCLASAVLFLAAHCATGLAFPSEQACTAYLAAHPLGAFFSTVLQFVFGFAVPDCMLLFYLHSITSPITAHRARRLAPGTLPGLASSTSSTTTTSTSSIPGTAAPATASVRGSINSASVRTAGGPGSGRGSGMGASGGGGGDGSSSSLACSMGAVSDTTPLLSSAAPVDPVSQLLLSAHQQSLFAASFGPAAAAAAPTGGIDSPLLDDATASTTSSLSSYSFLQAADSTPGLASPPPLGRADPDSDASECHGFFDTDSDTDSLYAAR